MLDKLLELIQEFWSGLNWLDLLVIFLIIFLPLIPLSYYMWVVHVHRKAGLITDRSNTADKVALTLYLSAIPISLAIHLYFKLNAFVSLAMVWSIFGLLVYLVWRFLKFMAARELKLRRQYLAARQREIINENRRKKGMPPLPPLK